MAAPGDESQFAKLMIDRRFATPEEIELCKARQREYHEQGKRVPLAQVLLEMGYVTKSQLRRMAGGMEDSMSRPAEQIPGYKILGKIGAGAMASVYKAKQLSLDRIVAIKILPKRLSENPEFVERFYREGRAAAKLNHNNIVQAIDVGESGGYHYFAMEHIDGKTVYDDLADGKPYDEKMAIHIVTQVARALEHAHDRGLIHRDVKPKNIMLTRDNLAKLADMGLAREASDMQVAAAEAGRAYGTPYYISPEQIRGELNIDHRADIYSLGATFYHMVTGRVPFEGSTPSAVMHKHLREPLVPPDHLKPNLTSGVAEVIETMMAKSRNDRYANAHDLIQDLELVARGESPPCWRGADTTRGRWRIWRGAVRPSTCLPSRCTPRERCGRSIGPSSSSSRCSWPSRSYSILCSC
jgi:serine/threonine-protein kinase